MAISVSDGAGRRRALALQAARLLQPAARECMGALRHTSTPVLRGYPDPGLRADAVPVHVQHAHLASAGIRALLKDRERQRPAEQLLLLRLLGSPAQSGSTRGPSLGQPSMHAGIVLVGDQDV